MADNQYIIFLGNPGVGKSTMINQLAGDVVAKAGFSIGAGLTKGMKLIKADGFSYVDTPGLADVQARKQAGLEITEALKQDGVYKLIFVVTLQGGRVAPQDLSTICTVLDAVKLPAGKNPAFSVIVNKLSPTAMKIFKSEENRTQLARSMAATKYTPAKVHFEALNLDLMDADNVVRGLSAALYDFVKAAPPVVIRPKQVDEIKTDDWQDQVEKLEEKYKKFEEEKASLEAERARMMENRGGDNPLEDIIKGIGLLFTAPVSVPLMLAAGRNPFGR